MRREAGGRVRAFDILDEAAASITRRRTRSALTMLGTLMGVGTYVTTFSLASTSAAQIGDQFDALKATEVAIVDTRPGDLDPLGPADPDQVLAGLNGVIAGGLAWDADQPETTVRSTPNVDPRGRNTHHLPIVAASPAYIQATRPSFTTGDNYHASLNASGAKVAVLGAAAARQLGIDETGQTAFIGNIPFTVVGIIGDVERDPNLLLAVVVPANTALNLWGQPANARQRFLIDVDLGAAHQVAREAVLALRPHDPHRLQAIVPPEPAQLRQTITAQADTLLILLAGVSLLIGGVGIANTALVSVMERIPEVGLRRAIGAKRHHIAAQFLTETTVLGALGGVLGTAGGMLLVVAVASSRQWTVVLEPTTLLLAPAIGTATGLLAGLYPALKASRLQPVDALRR